MNRKNLISLIHQFYKELKYATRKGKSPIVPFKYFFTYINQNRIKQDRLQNKTPWMTVPAIKLLESYVFPGTNVFEYGSGASTLFFGSKGAKVTSIEHDSVWCQIVKEKLIQEDFNKVSIILKEPKKSYSFDGVFSKKDKNYLQCDYTEYARAIKKFDDQFFDIVVIDGRVRVACLEEALPKLKKGGLLVFDNGDREEYQSALLKLKSYLLLSDYTVSSFDLSFSQTNIYKLV